MNTPVNECTCKETTCPTDCARNHTHHIYSCPLCTPSNDWRKEFNKQFKSKIQLQKNPDGVTVTRIKSFIQNLLTTHTAHLVADAKELYEALEMMWEQYCPEPETHLYMTAGENCEEMLQKHNKYSGQAIDIVNDNNK